MKSADEKCLSGREGLNIFQSRFGIVFWDPFFVLAFKPFSEQLPSRSAEVNIFSVFLCQRRREIYYLILVKFSVLRFPGFGCARENFTKISRQKQGVKNGKFHANVTLLGRSADRFPARFFYIFGASFVLQTCRPK